VVNDLKLPTGIEKQRQELELPTWHKILQLALNTVGQRINPTVYVPEAGDDK